MLNVGMKICFTKHAQEKLMAFQGGIVPITSEDIIQTILMPDFVDVHSRKPQCIAQREIDAKHILRVVYTVETEKKIKVITFYPGRKSQYEK